MQTSNKQRIYNYIVSSSGKFPVGFIAKKLDIQNDCVRSNLESFRHCGVLKKTGSRYKGVVYEWTGKVLEFEESDTEMIRKMAVNLLEYNKGVYFSRHQIAQKLKIKQSKAKSILEYLVENDFCNLDANWRMQNSSSNVIHLYGVGEWTGKTSSKLSLKPRTEAQKYKKDNHSIDGYQCPNLMKIFNNAMSVSVSA